MVQPALSRRAAPKGMVGVVGAAMASGVLAACGGSAASSTAAPQGAVPTAVPAQAAPTAAATGVTNAAPAVAAGASATAAPVSITSHWNDFIWPLLVTNTPRSRPLTVGLASFTQASESGAEFPLSWAARCP